MIEKTLQTARYSATARAFHWLTVVLIVLQFGIAWSMPDVGRGTVPVGLIGWHLSFGTAILALTIVRLAYRVIDQPPALPRSLPLAVNLLARTTQGVIYTLLIVLPVVGWINANARGWAVRLFGIVDLPQLVAKGTLWGMRMGDIHGNLAIVLLIAIGLHLSGAAYHAIILKDQTRDRMLPNR